MKKILKLIYSLGLSISNWWTFLYVNCLSDKIERAKPFLFRNESHSIVQLEDGAKIVLNSGLLIGRKQVKKSKLETRILLEERGRIVVNGAFTCFAGSYIRIIPNGELIVDGGFINENVQIVAGATIHIGKGATIGRDVVIRSYDGHFIERNGYKVSEPITIGEHVWIGQGATILKGVNIGDGCIIASGSIVTKDIPPYSLAAGVPARVISNDIKWHN